MGKRRAEFVRGSKAMDGIKRVGRTLLGRAPSNASKRGLAKRRFSFMAVFVITSFIAARVHTPDGNFPCDRGRKARAKHSAKT